MRRSGCAQRSSWLLVLLLACSGGEDDGGQERSGERNRSSERARPGGPIEDDEELRCNFDERLWDGQCEPLGQAGAECLRDDDCEALLLCRFEPSQCVTEDCGELEGPGVCGERGARREPCVPALEQCAEGLICFPSDRTCGPPGTYGAPCAGDSECEGSLVCRSYEDGGACGMSSGIGDVCNAYADCADGLVCYSDGRCAEPHGAAAGFVCTTDEECQEDLICNMSAPERQGVPTCLPPNASGSSCFRDAECGEGTLCIGQRCRERGELGDACEDDDDCSGGLNCNLADPAFPEDAVGGCQPLGVAGAACWFSDDCEAGLECRYPDDVEAPPNGSCEHSEEASAS